jgi:hypothetical protein
MDTRTPEPQSLQNIRFPCIRLADEDVHPAAIEIEFADGFEVSDGELVDHGGAA